MKLRRRNITVGFGLLFVILVGWILYSTYASYHTLKITAPEGTRFLIYEATQGDGSTELSYNPEALTGESVGPRDFRVQDGRYVIIVPEQQDFRELRKLAIVSGHNKAINIEPEYSQAKLIELLTPEESSKITTTLSAKYPRINLYEIQVGKLYKQGEWYATILKYKDQADIFNSDTLRVVLQKQDGVWKVVTDPPSIVISKAMYKEIPGDIIDDINSYQ